MQLFLDTQKNIFSFNSLFILIIYRNPLFNYLIYKYESNYCNY